MSKYQDRDTYWHDKPCSLGYPSSNNRNIYTAYSKYLAPNTLDRRKIESAFSDCIVLRNPMCINRLPRKMRPMLSKDEVIGLVSLGLIDYNMLSKSHFNFANVDYGPRKLTLKTTVKALLAIFKARNEHRNYLWKNNVYDAFPLMFKLMPEDTYYVKKMFGKRTNLLEFIIFYINLLLVFTKGDKSSRMLLFLKLSDMKHWALKYVPTKKWVEDYFEEGHDFRRGL